MFRQLNAALVLFMSVIRPTLSRKLDPEMPGKQVMPNQNKKTQKDNFLMIKDVS